VSTFWREAPTRGASLCSTCTRAHERRRLAPVPRADRRLRARPARLRPLRQAAHLDYSIAGYSRFLRAYVDHLGLDHFSIVAHDWGSVGLALAQAMPERIERLVAINVVPFLPGYRWHRVARIWRTPILGELFMGYSFRWAMKRASGEWLAAPGPAPDEMVDAVWDHFDHGTQRAILKLYRSAPPATLEAAGEGLGRIEAPRAHPLGRGRPVPPDGLRSSARGPARRARAGRGDRGARHWPWLDKPELVDEVAGFLLGERPVSRHLVL